MGKDLFDVSVAKEVKERLAYVRPEGGRQWGKMSAAQMMAHCVNTFAMPRGEIVPPRSFLGRIVGPMAKKSLILEGKPMMRNSNSFKEVIVTDTRDFAVERARLEAEIDRFVAAGPAACKQQEHFFFGPMTPKDWAVLMYQHLDHHLRQFGA